MGGIGWDGRMGWGWENGMGLEERGWDEKVEMDGMRLEGGDKSVCIESQLFFYKLMYMNKIFV